MQAVILAAGMATRLRPLTDETPKCLLLLDEKPILYYMLKNLLDNGIDELVMVTGFQREKLENYVKSNFPQIKAEFIYNERYDETNNAYSLLLAKNAVKKDFILLDSDILFHPKIIELLKKSEQLPVLAVERHACGEEEIKVTVDEKLRIGEISKEVQTKLAWGESVGIELFDEKSKDVLFEMLEKRIAGEKRENEFYEASFQEMIEKGQDFYVIDISDYPAMEIDFQEDFEKARELIKSIY